MATQQKGKPVILQDSKKTEQTTEIIADAIITVAAAAKKLLSSNLSRRAIVVLIQDAAPKNLSFSDIEAVLNTAANLDVKYIKKV